MGYYYDVSGAIELDNNTPPNVVELFEEMLTHYFEWDVANTPDSLSYYISSCDTYVHDTIDSIYDSYCEYIVGLEIYVDGEEREDFTKIVDDPVNHKLIIYFGHIVYDDADIDELCRMLGVNKRRCAINRNALDKLL